MKNSPPPSEKQGPPGRLSRNRLGLLVDAETSLRMAGVRQKDTSAEQLVRSLLVRLGHAFRKSNRDLPGSPDAANRSRLWAVFVHGCFWHRHAGCPRTTTPKRNRAFWEAKFDQNRRRDASALTALRRLGYRTIVVWECEMKKRPETVERKLVKRLGPAPRQRTRKREA